MRRVIAVLSVMALMVSATALPAFAAGLGPSECKGERPGEYISYVARNEGHFGYYNPGNAHSDFRPFVPFVTNENNIACNPNA